MNEESWKKPIQVRKAIKDKKTPRKCSKCKFYESAKTGHCINPRCQRTILTNNEYCCSIFFKQEEEE